MAVYKPLHQVQKPLARNGYKILKKGEPIIYQLYKCQDNETILLTYEQIHIHNQHDAVFCIWICNGAKNINC